MKYLRKMLYKSYFRSSVGHDVIDNKLTIVSLCRIAIGFVLLREVSDPLCYFRNRKGKIIFGSGVGGVTFWLLSGGTFLCRSSSSSQLDVSIRETE